MSIDLDDDAPKNMTVWLAALVDSGHVHVPLPAAVLPDELRAVRQMIVQMEQVWRLDMPLEPPDLDLDAATWAAGMLYRACQFFVFREIGEDAVRKTLEEKCPSLKGGTTASPEIVYSVDLLFRFLPDLIALARGIAQNDPLVVGLMDLARDWPMSSVGVRGLLELDIEGIVEHPALRRMYADRIIERADVSRLSNDDAVEAVREALGDHPGLAPALVSALSQDGHAPDNATHDRPPIESHPSH